ncbi:MAG: ankyrin repeat domain-containing protein [Acidobacteriota bacterium]
MDVDWYEKERLHRAAESGDVEEIKALLEEGLPIGAFDEVLSRTPLHCAAISGHIDAARYLIEAGADVNAHEEEKIGETPLGAAAATCSFEMAKILVDAGADPTIPGWMALTALDRSAERTGPDGERVHRLLVDIVKRRNPNWSRLAKYL